MGRRSDFESWILSQLVAQNPNLPSAKLSRAKAAPCSLLEGTTYLAIDRVC
jgi:hypothetical protein